MSFISGADIDSFTVTSPSLGNFRFLPISGESNTFDMGGLRNQDNGTVAAGGKRVQSKYRVPGIFEFAAVGDDPINLNEYQTACNLAGANEEQTWNIILLNGSQWTGTGAIEGDIKLDPLKATFSFKVVCGQGWTKSVNANY